MSENFKVNSKSSTLEFKRKHNKLVDAIPTEIANAIQADKDILSQIVYDGHSAILPKNVFPLRIIAESGNIYYISYYDGQIVYQDGTMMNVYISSSNGQITLEDWVDEIDEIIKEIDYWMSNGVNVNNNLNTYLLYYPQSGTKLYKHKVVWENSDSEMTFISTNPTLITSTTTWLEIYNNYLKESISNLSYYHEGGVAVPLRNWFACNSAKIDIYGFSETGASFLGGSNDGEEFLFTATLINFVSDVVTPL